MSKLRDKVDASRFTDCDAKQSNSIDTNTMATSAANAATNGAMKSLSSAPALSRLFFLTEKNIAEGLISNYRRMALQGETVCSAYLGSKQMAVALHPETAKQIVTQPELFPKTGAREEYSPFAELSRVDNTWQPSLVRTLVGRFGVDQRRCSYPITTKTKQT